MAFRNIVLFGVGGALIGHHLLKALVNDKTFNVTVLARESSKTKYPHAVTVSKVSDGFPHDELVAVLHGQDVVISAIGFRAQDEQYRLIDAAVSAGVKRFIPSEWGMDNGDPMNQELSPVFKGKAEVADYLRSKESKNFSWTAIATGIWLDWALDTKFLGIDPVAHTVQYWEGGSHTPSHTTLAYAAQAVADVLKHPDLGVNQRIFLSPFQASQREIVTELETQQGVEYTANHVEGHDDVEQAKVKWIRERDENAAYILVSAGILLPEYRSDFETAGKQPILEKLIEMRKLTLEDVVREWLIVKARSKSTDC